MMVLGNGGHALIYVGGYEFCEVGGSNSGIGTRTITDSSSYFTGHTWHYLRVSEDFAENLTDLDTSFSGTTITSSYDESEFYFNGIPDGTYSIVNRSLWDALINTLASIADYIIGILTYIIRIVIVGWTSIIDRLFNWTIDSVTNIGTEEDLGISGADVDEEDSDSRITLEALFYGEYDLVDINIFKNN